MALLMFRTFGVIIVSFIVLIMYVLHRKKNGKFIKRKAVNEEEKITQIEPGISTNSLKFGCSILALFLALRQKHGQNPQSTKQHNTLHRQHKK